jgi:hypothetical protein
MVYPSPTMLWKDTMLNHPVENEDFARLNYINYIRGLLPQLPYAYHSAGDVNVLSDSLSTDPIWVRDELERDSRCHRDCGNEIKAEVIQGIANLVAALL